MLTKLANKTLSKSLQKKAAKELEALGIDPNEVLTENVRKKLDELVETIAADVGYIHLGKIAAVAALKANDDE